MSCHGPGLGFPIRSAESASNKTRIAKQTVSCRFRPSRRGVVLLSPDRVAGIPHPASYDREQRRATSARSRAMRTLGIRHRHRRPPGRRRPRSEPPRHRPDGRQSNRRAISPLIVIVGSQGSSCGRDERPRGERHRPTLARLALSQGSNTFISGRGFPKCAPAPPLIGGEENPSLAAWTVRELCGDISQKPISDTGCESKRRFRFSPRFLRLRPLPVTPSSRDRRRRSEPSTRFSPTHCYP